MARRRKQEVVEAPAMQEQQQFNVAMLNGAGTLTNFKEMANALYENCPDPDNTIVATSEEALYNYMDSKMEEIGLDHLNSVIPQPELPSQEAIDNGARVVTDITDQQNGIMLDAVSECMDVLGNAAQVMVGILHDATMDVCDKTVDAVVMAVKKDNR